MDLSIAAASNGLAAARVGVEVSTAVLRNSLDAQSAAVTTLLERSLGTTRPKVGRLVDVQA